jgi:hypothetical protein
MARGPQPVRVTVAGRSLPCVVCDGDRFTVRSITLITSGFANSGANTRAEVATCAACGYLHQFVLGSLETRPYDD